MKALACSFPSSNDSPSSTSSVKMPSSPLTVKSAPPCSRKRLKWSRRKRKPPLSCHQWRRAFTSEGRLRKGGEKFLKIVRNRGVEHSIRSEVWPFLLGVYDMNSTKEERTFQRTQQRAEYETLRRQCQWRNFHHSSPENSCDSDSSRGGEGYATWQKIIRVDAVRDNSDWLPYKSPVSEAAAVLMAEAVGLRDYEHLEPIRILHAARLVAVLEAYAVHDPETGYCQGMSELLSPMLCVFAENHEAFWCFARLMRRARQNFRVDESGIRRQLGMVASIIRCKDGELYRHLEGMGGGDCVFAYRMVVVMMRRELTCEQAIGLWEVVWAEEAAGRAGDMVVYAVAAALLQRRKTIVETLCSVEEVIGECNGMTGHLDVWKLLRDARRLLLNVRHKIRASSA